MDAFPDSRAGWRDLVPEPPALELTSEAQLQIKKLLSCGGPDLADIARIQLTLQSATPVRQRISGTPGGEQILAYRTWRIFFVKNGGKVLVTGIGSGYSSSELAAADDRYCDKAIHRVFLDQK